MRRLKKFEELNYSTYASAADKIDKLGQKEKSEELLRHGLKMSRKFSDEATFSIVVGDVREFPSAKFESLNIFKSYGVWTLRAIFKSDSVNTHRIDSTVSNDGKIEWKDGNKFLDKKSTLRFQGVINEISSFQLDFQSFFSETGLTTEDLKLVLRTYFK